MSQLQSHLDELRRRFADVTVVHQTSSETRLQVEDAGPANGCTLTLCVTLDAMFPRSPPSVTYFDGRRISIAATSDASPQSAWDPTASRLADAVANAFSNLANLWGSVVPPSRDVLVAQLGSLSDLMLRDVISNQNCLESYAYQMPFSKALRTASEQTIDEIERVAKENMNLQPEIEKLRDEVRELQQRLAEAVERLQGLQESTPLLNSIGTPQNVAKTFAKHVKTLDKECEETAKKLLQVNCATEKRLFDNLLEEYTQKAKERHIMDLKRRAYYASLS